MNLSDFHAGDAVVYIPLHANGDASHPDCQRGVVSSIGDRFIFVRYYSRHGLLVNSGIATRPDDLVIDLTSHPVGQE